MKGGQVSRVCTKWAWRHTRQLQVTQNNCCNYLPPLHSSTRNGG